ncbi:MAG: diguanylate cyclase [Sterolibacterium sp.]|jgi:diguanylate cyclase (GGDEF)-like protein/PAS domain S-box-containing protein
MATREEPSFITQTTTRTARQNAGADGAEEILKTLLDNLPSGVTIFGANFEMIVCNAKLREMLEFPPELFADGLPSLEMLFRFNAGRGEYGQGDPDQQTAAALARAREMQPHVFERTRPNGTVLEIRGTPMPGGGFVSIYTDVTERRHAEQALQESAAQLRLIYDTASVAIFDVNMQGVITHANRRMAEMFGCSMENLVGSEYVAHIHPSEREIGRQKMLALMASNIPSVDLERHYWREDGSEFVGHLTGRQILDSQGQAIGLVGVIMDVTERRQLEEVQLLASTVLNAVGEGVCVTDAENRIISVNPAFTKITGYTREEALGQNPRLLASGQHGPEYFREMWERLDSHGSWQGEIRNRRKSGEIFVEWLSINQVHNEHGTLKYHVAVFSDISERKAAEMRVHDLLTDLPNRTLFTDRLQQALAKAKRDKTRLALMYLDFDKFKPVNDTFGHAVGDLLLKDAAQRMQHCVRESDTVARIGGDEFVVLLPSVESAQDALAVAEKLRLGLDQPFELAGHVMNISASIGVAVYPEHGHDEDELSKNADAAMYLAKQNGRNNVKLFR